MVVIWDSSSIDQEPDSLVAYLLKIHDSYQGGFPDGFSLTATLSGANFYSYTIKVNCFLMADYQ
jgi:hypothetical protein